MRTLSKFATVATIAGTLALAAATPSQARWGGHHHGGAAAAIGFGAGALVGAAAASAAYPGYYDYGYYGPDYVYAPGPYDYGYDSYAYVPRARYHSHRGGSCIQSPASINYTSCD